MAKRPTQGKQRTGLTRRRAARLGAVQALYQIELTGEPADRVADEFDAHRLSDLLAEFEPGDDSPDVDREWFRLLVRGTAQRVAELDPEIAGCLAPGWTLERLGYLMRACLRAGAFEIAARPDVPVATVIDEYVDLAHGFFEAGEPGFVHAVLDRLGQRLRPGPIPEPPVGRA